jgi:hypothetical protein
MSRKAIPQAVKIKVLTEAGYRCAVPTCRTILAIDLHHMVEVSEGGADEQDNLLALCPTCHALYHRGTINRESIYAWKSMLLSLSHAFDTHTLDDLIFLSSEKIPSLGVSGDGVLKFSRLIAAGLAEFELIMQNGPIVLYGVKLTNKGNFLVNAWKSGRKDQVEIAFTGLSSSTAISYK